MFLSSLGLAAALGAVPQADGERALREAKRFRALFMHTVESQGVSEAEATKLVFLPTADLLAPTAEAMMARDASEANAANLKQAASAHAAPAVLYRNAQNTPAETLDPAAIYAAKGPVTLVIVPGIFGEFIDKPAIYEMFNAPSHFAENQGLLSGIEDQGYSLAADKVQTVALTSRVRLGGIDGPNGEVRVQAIALLAGFGSLETLGENADNAAIYLRRLNKVFAALPVEAQRNIYLLGYSQGANTVLDMVLKARATPQAYPFVGNLKGVVSMSGVLYGTEVADEAFDRPASASYQSLHHMQMMLDDLQVAEDGDSFVTSTGKLLHNWADILMAIQAMASVPQPPLDPGIWQEHLLLALVDPVQMVDQLGHVFTDLFKPGLSPAEHLANLGRARKLLRAVIGGMRGLSTKARAQWWKEHLWPTDLPIYTVATTMPDATVDAVKSPLLDLPAFGGGTPDYQLILRPGFYMMRAASGGALANDSQVVTLKEQIKPALVSKWNPRQRAFPTHFMGIMGTHHWGVAFPNALEPALGGGNSFPRRAFAEAMGAFLLDPG